jgi:predicted amidohydrolase YtcJ
LLRICAERGITSAGIAGGSAQSFRQYEAVRDAGGPVRMGFMHSEGSFSHWEAIGVKSGFGDDRLRATSIKVFHDNSLSGRTCWLSEEYSDQPGYFGIPPARSQADLDKAFQAMHDAGFQIATHSNGDREIDMVLTAIERTQAKNPRPDARHRIEHASVMSQSMLERAKKAGVILVFHSYVWEHGDKPASFGEKRLAMIHPYRTAIDMGIHVAGHSDFHSLRRRPPAAHPGSGHSQGRERRGLRRQSTRQCGRGDQGMDARRRLCHIWRTR